jgi:hypothetical protein
VIEGLDVIDKIATVEIDHYDHPMYDVIIETIKPVVEEVEVAADTTAVCNTVAPCDSVVKEN